MLGMKKYSPPRSTLNVSMPWTRRLTGSFGMVKTAPSSWRPMIGSRSSPIPQEIPLVDPLLLQEFHRGHRLGADEQEDGAAGYFVGFGGYGVGIVWRSIRRAPSDQTMDIDVGQAGELGVPRVHPPDVASERRLESAHVVRVVEVVVPPRVRAQDRVVALRRQGQRGAAPPPADQLGGEQLPLLLGAAMGSEEPIEGADPGLILAKAHIGAVAAEDLRLRHRQGNAGLTGISQDELAGLDQRPLARERLGAAALDRRLVDAVFVTQGIRSPG